MPHNEKHLPTLKNTESGTEFENDSHNNIFPYDTTKYLEDFEGASDQDIEGILEAMSKLADSLSASSLSESIECSQKSCVQKEKSLEELLLEATELVRINAYCLSEGAFKSDSESEATENFSASKYETNIFEKIEEEIHRGLHNHQYSVFEESKKQLSTSYIRNSSERNVTPQLFESAENLDIPNNNLQKELTDVDENFFVHVLSSCAADNGNHVKLDALHVEEDEIFMSSKQLSLENKENNSTLNDSPKMFDRGSENFLQNAPNVNTKSVNLEVLSLTPKSAIFSQNASEPMKATSSEFDNLKKQDTNDKKDDSLFLTAVVNENVILPTNSVNNDNCSSPNKSTNEIFQSFNWIPDTQEKCKTNFTYQKSPREIQHKKPFTKAKVVSKSNFINKVKIPLKPRKELFTLKKQNIVLKEKNELLIKKKPELIKNEGKSSVKTSEEIRKLTDSHEKEKIEFLKNNETLHKEINNLQQEVIPKKLQELHRQANEIKELHKEINNLNIELSELKQQNLDYLLNYDDTKQQNCLLSDELKMFKEQLNEKNNFISERLQLLTTSELNLRKEMENLQKELNIKNESLKITKLNFEKLEQTILPIEKELLELRIKEGNFQEQLKVAKCHIEREKQLSLKLKNQVILDSKKIMDLLRQIREMERIMMKKNPDSISALLSSSNTEQANINLEKIKLLEVRNASLENEIKIKEESAQQRLSIFRKDFDEMIKKYATQILDLEDKLSSQSIRESENYIDNSTQTESFNPPDESENLIPTDEQREHLRLLKNNSLKSQNKRNDVHLIATICKLKFELSNKNKSLSKLSKEFIELQKTNRRLQTEREKQLNEARLAPKNVSLKKNNGNTGIFKSKSSDINYNNSNACAVQCDCKDNVQNRPTSHNSKKYNPLQYHENSGNNSTVKNLTTENNILREELFKMKKDFMALKNKRLHDLNLLQEEHERELKAFVHKCNAKEEQINMLKLEVKKVIAVHANSHAGSNVELTGSGHRLQML
ncbi:putative leucine-rich repeat-containing protein DDB_G0290503 [Leptopilina heterotoma]|uniref:putative leucine-rich repeat-containing protein DDB_G0290503 n=1 Tax=Leptopilina heterotoma TaxID=63436 RepID=UPI001CA97592|nr:putative leucine-rich repeat-containing protein DDB_G0290503 [Leptopilina heterotoma]